MKNATINKFILALIFSLAVISCKKSNDSDIKSFIDGYNSSIVNISQKNPVFESSTAKKTGENEVTLFLKLSVEGSSMEAQMLKKSLPELFGQLLNSSSKNGNLIEEGVNFKVELLDKNNTKLVSENLDKNAFKGSNLNVDNLANGSASAEDLNKMLAVFNKSLPITEPSSGIKIMKMEAGTDHDVIYTAEVPDALKPAFQKNDAATNLKTEMLKNPQMQQVLTSTSQYGITNLKYNYIDTQGNSLLEIKIEQSDF